MNDYVLTVGLEVHAELKTRTKMFCDSKNDPDESRPNVNICPICMGHPGTLPVPNMEAVRLVQKIGIALGGTLAEFTEFDRKNYFYPDIPKGYQLSQYEFPLVSGGSLRGVSITRVHLEEDTATSIHESRIMHRKARDYSLLDFNRAGVPLMELVTEPVIHTARDAGDFARELQLLLRYLNVCDANMEKGEMRVEANISVSKQTEIADTRGYEDSRMNADKLLLYEDLSYKIRGAAFAVYNALGSDQKESVYQNALAEEFRKIALTFEREKNISVTHNDIRVGSYQPDFFIDGTIILEIKALPFVGKIEREQLRYYLMNSPYRLGMLINFGARPIQIERIIFDSIRDNPQSNPRKSAPLGTKVEVKNLNSFHSVERAIEYESERHASLLERGERIMQETRGWDESLGKTVSQRRKEETQDYRYFPDPDCPKLLVRNGTELCDDALRKSIPVLPAERRSRYGEIGIKATDAETLVVNRSLASLFEDASAELLSNRERVLAASYITSDLIGRVKEAGGDADSVGFKFSPTAFAMLIHMLAENKLSSRAGKDILFELFDAGGDPVEIATRRDLFQTSDADVLKRVVKEVVAANERVVRDYKNGKAAALQYLVGQGMKATKGAAHPAILREVFVSLLK